MTLGSPGGPVAVVAATAESHPLPNYYASVSLMKSLKGDKRRIGDVWLDAQAEALKAKDAMIETMMADVEGKLEQQIDVGRLKHQQTLLYEILGDPATPLFVPAPLDATIERTDSGWRWKATKPEGATRLYVGVRTGAPPAAGSRTNRPEQARAAYEKANSAMAFVPAESPKPGAAWEGTVAKPCSLRLVATGPGVFRVALLEAEVP